MPCQMLPNEGQSQAGVCPPRPLLHFPINELAGDLTPGCLALTRIQSWEWAAGSSRRRAGRSGLEASSPCFWDRPEKLLPQAAEKEASQAAGVPQLWAAMSESPRPPVQWPRKTSSLLLSPFLLPRAYCGPHSQAPAERI